MTDYIDATHNMLYTLDRDAWREDLAKSSEGDVTGYQEANLKPARTALREYCAEEGRGLFHPIRTDLPISWKSDVFASVKVGRKIIRGVIESHPSAIQMGIPAPANPARDITYVGLTHLATRRKILRVNVHPLAGATRRESDPDHTDSAALSTYKDWGIGQYWLDVVSFVAGQMSLQDPGAQTMSSFWDVVSLGGDYNAALDNVSRWYYPGCLLPALFVDDKKMRGLDHLQHGHGSDVKIKRRWDVVGNTDHRIHFIERSLVEVADFPRER